MKTLILTGSPRKNGATYDLVNYLTPMLEGEFEIVNLDHRKDITPCRDCRYCFKHPECVIKDGMQEIYRKIEEADRVIFASPIYFYTLPGSMKSVLDRLQVYWAALAIRKEERPLTKKGAVLLVGGAPAHKGQFEGAITTLTCMMGDIGAEYVGGVTMWGTDRRSLEDCPEIQEELRGLAEKLNH